MNDAKKPSRSSLPVPDADAPAIQQLIAVMAALRDPDGGCPWDIEQTFATIAPYAIEEAYEVAEAINQGDLAALKDELGDLLLQVVAKVASQIVAQHLSPFPKFVSSLDHQHRLLTHLSLDFSLFE